MNRYLIILFLFVLSSCRMTYSFREGAIPADVSTISIQTFVNESGNGPPNMSQRFSERVRSFYQDNTRLTIVNNNGDWQLQGSIVGFTITPVAPQAGASPIAGQNRLTVTVNAIFINTKDEEQSFTQPFSFYYDFAQNQSLTQVENEALEVIFNQIILDMFNRTTSTW